MTTPVLIATGISKRFGGVCALDNVDIRVFPGEVLCLAGANGSGKSTLIKVISGVEKPDAGNITIGKTTLEKLNPRQGAQLGVEVIFQDFSLLPNLTVAENIAISDYVTSRSMFVNQGKVRRLAQQAIAKVGIQLPLQAKVEDLSVADRQLTAICRALAHDATVLFMDEPTTALTRREVEKLFAVVDKLKRAGVGIVFVSHKLEEVLHISDRITVLRNGAVTADGDVADFDRATLIAAMIGRDLAQMVPTDASQEAEPLLRVRELGRVGVFRNVSFDLRPCEILGITGLLGSGRSEIAEALFGSLPATSGTIEIDGQPVSIRSTHAAIKAGIGYVPEDRLTQGIFLDLSIAANVTAGSLERLVGRLHLLRKRLSRDMVRRWTGELGIRMSSPQASAKSLSGGNQQRVVLAKWLAREPKILILNSPTVGVDIGSKTDILEFLKAKAAAGVGIVVISDDVPELVGICHRVLVVRDGTIVDELTGRRLTEDDILKGLNI